MSTPEIFTSMMEWIEENGSVTLRELLLSHLNVTLCISTVKNWLDGQLISVNIVRPIPCTMNSEENLRKLSAEQLFSYANRVYMILMILWKYITHPPQEEKPW